VVATTPPGTPWARPRRWTSSSTGDGRLAAAVSAVPADIVVLDGAYSARPELADLFGLRVLLQVARATRRERLLLREGEHDRAEWEARWGEAEDLYFESVMPPEAFDLVIDES